MIDYEKLHYCNQVIILEHLLFQLSKQIENKVSGNGKIVTHY